MKILLILLPLLVSCQMQVGATVGFTRTAEQSATKVTETTVTSNPEKTKTKSEETKDEDASIF